jgi:PAS domain S-box-containing protein
MSQPPLRVLLVDDDEDYFVIVRDLLAEAETFPVQLRWLDSYDEALFALSQNHTDVVIVDYQLGAQTGLELLRTAVARKIATPFILLTGQGDQEIAAEAMKAGATDYLVKGQVTTPLLERSLRHAVETAEHRQLMRRMVEILETTHDLVASCDDRGVLIYLNAAGRRMLGVPADQPAGALRLGQFHPPAVFDQMFQTAAAQGSWNGETALRAQHGAEIPVLETLVAHKSADGRPTYFSCTARDITDRKRAEDLLWQTNKHLRDALDELHAAEEKVIQQERLRALGTMASGIAHDFNNALATILGYSELLLHCPENLDNKERARRWLCALNTAARDAGDVVQRLREFYRHREQGGVVAPVDLNQLVQDTVALTQPRWLSEAQAKGISIEVRTDLQDQPLLAGYESELREALTNLIFNAVDAMPHGGTITLRTGRDGHHAVLALTDTGVGMTEEVRRRCLEPFFSTKGQHGAGLGLSTVYGTVTRHHGRIDIQSALGKGTTFTLRLPLGPANAIAAPSANVGDAAQPVRPRRILVVEDETVLRDVIAEYLSTDGHTAETAGDGQEALEKFAAAEFDLVLLDRAMPGMSGDQVAARIKSSKPNLPVIMLTGFGAMMLASEEKPAGVDLVLGKPVTMAQLREAIAAVAPA